MKAFRDAVEAGDFDDLASLLAEDVVFRSPVAFKPYEGRPIVAAILRNVGEVFSDFRYVQELGNEAERASALVFEAKVGDAFVHGCDFIHVDDEGLIDDFTVMVRPLKGAQALAAAMGERFEAIAAEAAAAMSEDGSA